MDDLISRAAAFDSVEIFLKQTDAPEVYPGLIPALARVINNVPPAQPEIIRCKDCKYIRKWRSEESAKKFGQIYECERNVFDCPKPEDFCSHAKKKEE